MPEEPRTRRKPRRWTTAELVKMKGLLAAGVSWLEIAAELDRGVDAARSKAILVGLHKPTPRVKGCKPDRSRFRRVFGD